MPKLSKALGNHLWHWSQVTGKGSRWTKKDPEAGSLIARYSLLLNTGVLPQWSYQTQNLQKKKRENDVWKNYS